MATAAQLKALLKCHAEGDDERFCAAALQVAAQGARNGHTRFALCLRASLDQLVVEQVDRESGLRRLSGTRRDDTGLTPHRQKPYADVDAHEATRHPA